MLEGTYNPLEGFFGLLGKKIEAEAARDTARATFDAGGLGPMYGVDEYGRVYFRGAPTAASSPMGPVLAIGAGVVAVVLLVSAFKSKS